MTRREYFAGQALAGIMLSVTNGSLTPLPYEMKQIGELARDCADACIRALKDAPRKKTTPKPTNSQLVGSLKSGEGDVLHINSQKKIK